MEKANICKKNSLENLTENLACKKNRKILICLKIKTPKIIFSSPDVKI
jgi:hypothetical protein